MGAPDQDYRLSFFKPTTDQARLNRNLVVLLFTVWAIATFGFQIALKLLEKPTPEKAYTTFELVIPNVGSGTAVESDYQGLMQSSLAVLGKIFIKADEQILLESVVTWSLFQIADSSTAADLSTRIAAFESAKAVMTDITDPGYVAARNELGLMAASLAGIATNDPLIRILPLSLVSSAFTGTPPADLNRMNDIMKTYLIHNQSFLTDFKVLGFPFHYFYTAILLLILFVGLCWLYCIRIDRMNAKLNIAD